MRVLFATEREYLPENVSGAELCTDTLLAGLVARGHACSLVAAREPGWGRRFDRAKAVLSGRFRPWRSRYPVHRAPESDVAALFERQLDSFAPDVVVTHLKGTETVAERALARGVPVVAMVRDAEFEWHSGRLPADPRLRIVANSRYVAERVRERFGGEPEVLLPLVRKERFLARQLAPETVTFVNPVRLKGLEVALKLAGARPRQRFLFVRSWNVTPYVRGLLDSRLRFHPNVKVLAVREDMRSVYARTAVLLAPSQWEESFPRVVVETAWNGIPTLASDVGGMREAVGAGGLLLPRDAPVEAWAEALDRLLLPGETRERCSTDARRNAARPELDPERIVDAFVRLAETLRASR